MNSERAREAAWRGESQQAERERGHERVGAREGEGEAYLKLV